MSYSVLLTDHPWPGTEIEQAGLAVIGAELIDAPDAREQTLCELAEQVDAMITCWGQVTAPVIAAARHCRLVARLGIGLDNIDVAAATAQGMLVTNVPDYCVEEVADHAWGLLLALARNVGWFHLRTKRQEYNLKSGPVMHRLRGQTLGLLGLGRIGRAVLSRAQAFGMQVLAYSASGNDYGTGARMVTFEQLLTASDFISLHAPLNAGTRHLLNAKTLALSKPGQYIINTSRGPLIDPAALYEAIMSGQIAGAGLDVFEPEPPDLYEPLYQHERVIVTPHVAFVSEESVIELRQRVVQQVVACLQGRTPENVVNR